MHLIRHEAVINHYEIIFCFTLKTLSLFNHEIIDISMILTIRCHGNYCLCINVQTLKKYILLFTFIHRQKYYYFIKDTYKDLTCHVLPGMLKNLHKTYLASVDNVYKIYGHPLVS